MSSLLAGLRVFQQNNEVWEAHNLAWLIWNVVNEEFMARRQGRNSAAPMGNQGGGGGGQQPLFQGQQQGSRMLTLTHQPPDKRGTGCQSARGGGGARRGGRVQMVGQTQMFVSQEGVAFDM